MVIRGQRGRRKRKRKRQDGALNFSIFYSLQLRSSVYLRVAHRCVDDDQNPYEDPKPFSTFALLWFLRLEISLFPIISFQALSSHGS